MCRACGTHIACEQSYEILFGRNGRKILVDIFMIAASKQNVIKFRVFWDVAPCNHSEVDRRFRDAYCLHHQEIAEAGLNNI
jgi:hypothetical protein